MDICMYVHMYVCVYVHNYICVLCTMYIYIYTHACMYVRTCVHVCMYICMYVCAYTLHWSKSILQFSSLGFGNLVHSYRNQVCSCPSVLGKTSFFDKLIWPHNWPNELFFIWHCTFFLWARWRSQLQIQIHVHVWLYCH